MEHPVAERDVYRSSGRVGPEFFVLAMPLAVVAALMVGSALFGMWKIGFYFLIFIPLLAALPFAYALVLGVRLGSCRNRAIAAVYGAFGGALMYGSYYYIDMVDVQGPGHLLRVDAVPAHIRLRLQTDRVQAFRPHIGNNNVPATPWLNCLFFALEAVLVCSVTGAGAVVRAGKVYCEEADRWAECHILPLLPGKGQLIVIALAAGILDNCVSRLDVISLRLRQPYCELVLEVCPDSRDAKGCCAYLSLRELSGVTISKWYSHYSSPQGFLIRQRALTPDELRLFQNLLVRDGGQTGPPIRSSLTL